MCDFGAKPKYRLDALAIEISCDDCSEIYLIPCSETQWKAYQARYRKRIQDIFPELTINQREILISGTCGTCYDKLFEGRTNGR